MTIQVLKNSQESMEAKEGSGQQKVPLLIFVIGGGFLIFAIVLVIFGSFLNKEESDLIISGIIASIVMVYGKILKSERANISPDIHPLIAKWCLGGIAGFLVLVLILWLASGDLKADGDLITSLHLAGSIGAMVGLIIGTREGRSIQAARKAERALIEKQQAKNERNQLDFLNSFLRHETLNDLSIIQGNIELAREQIDGDSSADSYLDTVRERSKEIESTINDVRVFLEATTNEPSLEPVDLNKVLSEEIANLRKIYPAVEFQTHFSNAMWVRADEMVSRLFLNLLRNAAEYNSSDNPQVSVFVESVGDTVNVRVEDNGPGIPPDKQSNLFERGVGNHGIGLYLTEKLADRYGGEVYLESTGPDGSIFEVNLPTTAETPISEEEPRIPHKLKSKPI